MSREKVIVVGRDFTTTPIGRFRGDSPLSGEVFREDILIPALQEYDTVTVDLAGVEGYGSSFLEEVFGGLVRSARVTDKDMGKLKITSSQDHLKLFVDFALKYIKLASKP